jgi:hypothetical protein
MHARKIKIVASILGIATAAGIFCFRYLKPLPDVEPRPHLALGEALAAQAAKAIGPGGRITLIAPDIVAFKHPGAEVQLTAFHEALRQAKLSVAATNWIKLNPLYLRRVPPGDFAELLRKQSDGDVIVSLIGPPLLTPEQKARLGEKRPRVVAVCSGDLPLYFNLKSLFEDNLLHAAIINRRVPGPAPQSENLSQWFDHVFQWITAQNQADLPEAIVR